MYIPSASATSLNLSEQQMARAVFIVLSLFLAVFHVHGILQENSRQFGPSNKLDSQSDYYLDNSEEYINSWAVEIKGGEKVADRVARRNGFRNLGRVGAFKDIYNFEKIDGSRVRSNTPLSSSLENDRAVEFAEQQSRQPIETYSYAIPQDPLFNDQWHLLNTRFGYEGHDIKVEKAWLQGLTGCNVTVSVVDDGFDYKHPDLWPNFAPAVAYDATQNDTDPFSRYVSHGTSVGGIVGATQSEHCGIGVAPDVTLGGTRLLGGDITDMEISSSLSHARDIVDIYSNSWGPRDDGVIALKPGRLTKLAIEDGIEKGRDGKGAIFVFANGNGGERDDCGANGYSTSIYTISVGALGMDGFPSSYDEECSAKLVTAYVTNLQGVSDVVAPVTGGECRTSFGGTSSATPMVSGIIALTLEKNPSLTWRDVQYLIVYTANPDLTNGSQTINGAGLLVSHQYGFGVIDAEAMVSRARHWINVPPQIEHRISDFTRTSIHRVTYSANVNYGGNIRYLEHVVVEMNISVPFNHSSVTRGSLEIELTSPLRTRSFLLTRRPRDRNNYGFGNWSFMSVMFWGENPTGEWSLTVKTGDIVGVANVTNVSFIFYGVSSVPEAVRNIPEQCHEDCKRGCAGNTSNHCDSCRQLRDAYTLECINETCPDGYDERNDYCYESSRPLKECISPLKDKEGSGFTNEYDLTCVGNEYNECCTSGVCYVYISKPQCFCDHLCFKFGDCCEDVADIGCIEEDLQPFPFLELGSLTDVETITIPHHIARYELPDIYFPYTYSYESGISIVNDGSLQFGNGSFMKIIWVFETYPFVIDDSASTTSFEVHQGEKSQSLLSTASNIVNEHTFGSFNATWLLVVTWHMENNDGLINTFQGMLVTDNVSSYTVFTYNCAMMNFSIPGFIGVFDREYGISYFHPAYYREEPHEIACINTPQSPWVNIVLQLSQGVDECELEIDDCEQVCTNTFLSYDCSCATGYTLRSDGHNCTDIDECLSPDHGCEYRCVNVPGSFYCECQDGYALNPDGKTCKEINECTTENNDCKHNCTNTPGSYFCSCREGFELESDEHNCTDVDECMTSTDDCEQICMNIFGSYTCNCTTGFKLNADGLHCDDIDECLTLKDDCEEICINTVGSYSCDCYNGSKLDGDNTTCSDIDECQEGTDGCDQICNNTIGSYDCSCNIGFQLEDRYMCKNIDECATDQDECEQNCHDNEGSYSCSCRDGYTLNDDGYTCSVSCGGTLTGLVGSFQTPDWPTSYPSENFICEWIIDIEISDASIEIQFKEPFGIHGSQPCTTDNVEILVGEGDSSTSHGKFCGVDVPGDVTVDSNRVTVIFRGSTSSQGDRAGVAVSYKASVSALPFILGLDLETHYIPREDDALSLPILVPRTFPYGCGLQSTVYVGTNGYCTFDRFSGFTPYPFTGETGHSIVAPFFSDIDISQGHGEIFYQVLSNMSDSELIPIIDQINLVISTKEVTTFSAEWLLIASWMNVAPHDDYSVRGSFQAILATDYIKSYAVFIYKCEEGRAKFTERATIGFVTKDGMHENHDSSLTDDPLRTVSCLNPQGSYTNVVYKISGGCK